MNGHNFHSVKFESDSKDEENGILYNIAMVKYQRCDYCNDWIFEKKKKRKHEESHSKTKVYHCIECQTNMCGKCAQLDQTQQDFKIAHTACSLCRYIEQGQTDVYFHENFFICT